MFNPATQPQNELNDFTSKVRQFALFSKPDWGGYCVRLRNGELVRPVFMSAEDETCEDCFGTDRYRWNLDGTSVTRRDCDMMEIVRND
jgi:hypothetical protein